MKKLITIFFFFIIISSIRAQIDIDSTLLLHTDNILKITFNNNDKIKSAYYYLEAAKYNFKLFESEFTQFNPLIVSPKVNANSDREYSTDMTAGIQKEFFNGSSISASVGRFNDWGNEMEIGNINFIETEIGFPLFSSSRSLERIIKRTFEENELYTKNLNYVDAVRNNIKLSLEQYYDLVPRIKIYQMLKMYRLELNNLILNDTLKLSATDKEQIAGEINSLNSEITGWEITLYSLQLKLQRSMNVSRINFTQLKKIKIDFSKSEYWGKYYIKESIDTIFQKALNNDTEFKVLGIIKKNAEEKKRLAEKGKWDIFATTGGRYNFYEMFGGIKQNNFLTVDFGLKIKINDKKVLKNTIAKAEADINAIEYTIIDRRKLIQSDILQLKDALTKKKEQLISIAESLISWEKTYAVKKELYLSNQESVDNFIQAFRSLIQANQTFLNFENNYLDLVRDLDYVCGEYFTVINLQD